MNDIEVMDAEVQKLSPMDVKSDLLGDFGIIMTEDQQQGVQALLSGTDVVAAMPTGSGKSLIFQCITYSAAKRCMRFITLIVSPLKAISFTHIQTFRAKFGIRCLDAAVTEAKDFERNDYNALVVQPELLVSAKGRLILKALGEKCKMFVIDEAHCLKTWGSGDKPFRKNFSDLAKCIAKLMNRPVVLCLTATLTEVAEKLTLRSLGLDPDTVHKIEKNPVSRRISFHNKSGCLDIQPLVEHLCTGECPRVIIFEASLLNCGARYLEFKEALFAAERPELIKHVEVFHSQIPDSKQEEISTSLLTSDGTVKIVIATSALSMGFDAKGVEYIVHTQMAKSLEDFLQMSGRAGRKENVKAYCLLFTDKKSAFMEKCCDLYRKQETMCRRAFLAQYFEGGLEKHNNLENYACCDFCDPSMNDTFLKSLVKEKQTTLASFKDLQTHRTVRAREREDFRSALQYQQHFYTSNLPFVDPELTDGIIKVLSDHVNKIKAADDVLHLAPGLSLHIVEDIVEIIEELFLEK